MKKCYTVLSLSDLKTQTLSAIKTEINATHSLLLYLAEVDRRMAYVDWGYPSLFKLLVANGYSESSASERVQALRLIQKIPEATPLIQTGKLSLTTAAKVARFVRRESKEYGLRLSPPEKLALVHQASGKSKSELDTLFEQTIREKQPERTKERVKTVELRLDAQLLSKIERMREIRGHDLSLEYLLGLAAQAWLDKNDPKIKYSPKAQVENKNVNNIKIKETAAQKKAESCDSLKVNAPNLPSDLKPEIKTSEHRVLKSAAKSQHQTPLKNTQQAFIHAAEIVTSHSFQPKSRYVPAKVKRQVFIRDQGQCTLCGSMRLLQFDHIKRFGLGGGHESQNIRLLCRLCRIRHNLHYAEPYFMPNRALWFAFSCINSGHWMR